MDPEDYEKPAEEKNPLEKLRDSFREEVRQLVNLELDVEQLAERKLEMLRAYIRDDIHGVKTFWRDLQGDAHALEDFARHWLLRAADPTPVDWVTLRQHLEHGEERLMAGEEAENVELVCVGCGMLRVVEDRAVLRPCSRCGAGLYELRQKKHKGRSGKL